MRFHTAINKFCLNPLMRKFRFIRLRIINIDRIYPLKTHLNFQFCISNNSFENQIYNALSGNYKVSQIIRMIKKYKKNEKLKFFK